MKTMVVNRRVSECDVYVGRPSKWGNPFSHREGTSAKFRVATRAEAVLRFEKWVLEQPTIMASLGELRGRVLGCWCHPLPCHAHVLARLADQAAAPESFSIGQSKAKTWLQCRQAYHLKYVDRLQKRVSKRPLTFGKIVHRMLEAKAQEEDPFAVLDEIRLEDLNLFDSEREMYGDIIQDIRTIMLEYFDRYRDDDLRMVSVRDADGELRFAEHEFAIPLEEIVPRADRGRVSGIVLKGQIDAIAVRHRLSWLVEHKTFGNLPSDDERWRNLQSVAYARALVHLGWLRAVDGVCWNYINSKAPTEPHLLKNGRKLSVQKIVTLPSVVRAAIARHGLDEGDHEENLRRAEECRDNYFQRIYSPVSSVVADNIFGGLVDTAVEMRDNPDKREKCIGRHCSWCDYEPICRAELTGGDVDFARQDYAIEDPEGYRRSSRRAGHAGSGGQGVPVVRVLRKVRHGQDHDRRDVSGEEAAGRH